MKNSTRFPAAAALLALTATAHGGTLTMDGWLFGSGNGVNVGVPSYSGLAGGFKGTLSGLSDPRFNFTPVELYCADLAEAIGIGSGTTYSVKMDGEPGTTVFTIMSANAVFSSPVVDRLARLISYAESNSAIVDTSAESTSLQLAIWNTLYDPDATLQNGGFKDTSAYRFGADTLLSSSAGWTITKDLYVLRSIGNPGRQDQLIWIDKVPEPGTLALLALGLAGLGVTRRRRGR